MRTTILIFSALLFAILISTSAFAGSDVVFSDGSMQMKSSIVKKRLLNVTLTNEVAQYPKALREAIKNPGVVVPAREGMYHNRYIARGFDLEKRVIVEIGVLYDATLKKVSIVKDITVKKDRYFNPFFIFVTIAVVLMMWSGLLVVLYKDITEDVKYIVTIAFAIFMNFALYVIWPAFVPVVPGMFLYFIIINLIIFLTLRVLFNFDDERFMDLPDRACDYFTAKDRKRVYIIVSTVFYSIVGISASVMYL